MEALYWISLLIIGFIGLWLNEFKRCMKAQIKHNDVWGDDKWIDFCKNLP